MKEAANMTQISSIDHKDSSQNKSFSTISGITSDHSNAQDNFIALDKLLDKKEITFEEGVDFIKQVITQNGRYEVKFSDGSIEILEAEAAFEVAAKLRKRGVGEIIYIRQKKLD